MKWYITGFFLPKFWRLTEALSLQSIEFFLSILEFFGKVLEFFPRSLLYVLYKHIFLLWKALASTQKCIYIAKISKLVHKNDILGINPKKIFLCTIFSFEFFGWSLKNLRNVEFLAEKQPWVFSALSFLKTVKKSLA